MGPGTGGFCSAPHAGSVLHRQQELGLRDPAWISRCGSGPRRGFHSVRAGGLSPCLGWSKGVSGSWKPGHRGWGLTWGPPASLQPSSGSYLWARPALLSDGGWGPLVLPGMVALRRCPALKRPVLGACGRLGAGPGLGPALLWWQKAPSSRSWHVQSSAHPVLESQTQRRAGGAAVGGLQRQVPRPRPPSACRWEAWGGGELQTLSHCGSGAGLALGERLLHPGVREL